MWKIVYYTAQLKEWLYYLDATGSPRVFQTHAEAYHAMISLQKQGVEAYTERCY